MTRTIYSEAHEFDGARISIEIREIPGGACQWRVIGLCCGKVYKKYAFTGSYHHAKNTARKLTLKIVEELLDL